MLPFWDFGKVMLLLVIEGPDWRNEGIRVSEFVAEKLLFLRRKSYRSTDNRFCETFMVQRGVQNF